MSFVKKLSLLMDLRLLVHQNRIRSAPFFLLIFYTLSILFCATNVSSTESSIHNRITNDVQQQKYMSDTSTYISSQNSRHLMQPRADSPKPSPRILNTNSDSRTVSINSVETNTPKRQQVNDAIGFSQPLNSNDVISVVSNNINYSGFVPIQPHGIDQNYVQSALFTDDGHFRVFEQSSIAPTTTFAIHKTIQNQHREQALEEHEAQMVEHHSTEGFQPIKVSTNFHPIISAHPDLKLPQSSAESYNTTTKLNLIKSDVAKEKITKRHIRHKLDALERIRSNEGESASLFKQIQNATATESYMNVLQELINSNPVQNLKKYVLNLVHDVFVQDTYELFSGVRLETVKNSTTASEEERVTEEPNEDDDEKEEDNDETKGEEDDETQADEEQRRSLDTPSYAIGLTVGRELRRFVETKYLNVNVPRAMETGRLFIFKGLKKLLWPLFIGVQIAKSILLALFLPSILGSLGKIVGKGLVQVSGFNHQSEAVNDLDFKDNSFNMMNDDNKYIDDYSYPRPEASENHFTAHLYEKATNNMNNALQRFGLGDHKKPHTNTPTSLYMDTNSKNSNHHSTAGSMGGGMSAGAGSSASIGNNKNSYKDFLKVPSSSLLLSNYDPFYSPLLSRIDSVFAQLGIAKGQDACKEKLVCLMYAHPAKYAPYSNLVSAQLSRELNELRKPTSNNEEILRFFKYMKAAKDGQDGVKCEKTYDQCKEYQDSDDPVMITTYNDINKLVQARKISR